MLDYIIQKFVFQIMKSHFIAQLLFKIDFNPVKKGAYYFDTSTIVMTRLLLKEIHTHDRILDMGTGVSAIVGLFLWKHCGCHVVSCDINPDIVLMAQENIRLNQSPIRVIRSNLFENIDEDFDIVVFNPPYVPTKKGIIYNLSKKFQSQWDGGQDGSLVVKQFLNELHKITRPVKAYVGINYKLLPKENFLSVIEIHENLKLKKTYRHPILPIEIFIIEKK